MKIVQVLDYFADGNGVANCAVMYYKMTKQLGMESVIAARLIDEKTKKQYVLDISYLDELDESDIVMYHMCIGTPLNLTICSYRFQKVLVYHNITPPEMLMQYHDSVAKACREGLAQLDAMRSSFSVCLAMSEFNKQDLIRHGYEKDKITVIPPYIEKEEYLLKPDKTTWKKYNDGQVNIVFVGRISPNKKQEDLIRIFQYYKMYINADSRLIIAGAGEGKYYDKLQQYVKKIKLPDIIFTNQISFEKLLAVYQSASVFLCVSEHEGFCIPLIEAMCFDIPVIAYDCCAVKDTLGGAGILLQDKSPQLVARVIREVCEDLNLRQRIIRQQRERLQLLTQEAVFQKYERWFHSFQNYLNKQYVQSNIAREENSYPYNVVIVVKAADWDIARRNLKYIKRYLKPKQIVIIASAQMRQFVSPEDPIFFIDEDRLYKGLTFQKIRQFFEMRQMDLSLTGWYFQQFLKLAYAYICKEEYYLVWDADTIPLRDIPMMDEEMKRPYFDMKPEYISAYFSSIRNLTGMEKVEEESFIAEHMLFHTQIVKQMLATIEKNSFLSGRNFFEKILNAADYSQIERSFSEFELYGTFCQYVYPKLYKKRHLRTMRCGKMFLGAEPEEEVLAWAAQNKDTISFEYPQQVIERSRSLSKSKKFREKYTIDDLIKRIYTLDRLTFPEWLQKETDALKMDDSWAGKPAYLKSDDFQMVKRKKMEFQNTKIVVFGNSEELCFLSLLLARKGMQVVVVNSALGEQSIEHYEKYWGFQALWKSAYKENLNFAESISQKEKFQFAFFSSKQFKEYLVYEQMLQRTKKGMILENNCDLDRKKIESIHDVVLLNMSLLKSDALLIGEKESLLELCITKKDQESIIGLFSEYIQTKVFQNKSEFLEHVHNQNCYFRELTLLKQKYGVE